MADLLPTSGPGDGRRLLQLRAPDLPRLHDARPRSACAAPSAPGERTKVTTGTSSFGRSNAAPATYTLIAINVIGFLSEIAGGVGGLSRAAAP